MIAEDMYAELDEAKRIGAFFVNVAPWEPRYEVSSKLPAHRLVIRPLLMAASEARIVGKVKSTRIVRALKDISIRRRGYLELDLSRDLLNGREVLWNSEAWSRGAIIITCDFNRVNLSEIFKWCEGPMAWSSVYQMTKASPKAAIKYAQEVSARGHLSFLFSASNGIEGMDVFCPSNRLKSVFQIAKARCRKFKRDVEHNPGAKDEIIVDRPPYSTTI